MIRHLKYPNLNYTEKFMSIIEHDLVCKCSKTHLQGIDQENLAQDLRIHLWRKMSKYDPTKSAVRTWANAVMENRIRDEVRRVKSRNHDLLDDPQTLFLEVL